MARSCGNWEAEEEGQQERDPGRVTRDSLTEPVTPQQTLLGRGRGSSCTSQGRTLQATSLGSAGDKGRKAPYVTRAGDFSKGDEGLKERSHRSLTTVTSLQIDNQRSRLPASLSEGRLRVHKSGTRGVIEMDFGLVVTYDWDGQLTLSLPKRFQDQVSGLCGNYNGDPADDFLTPDGKQAPDVLNFTKSWKVNDQDLLCDDGCYGNCPSCIPSQAQLFKKDLFCGMLTLPSGPFADCHQFLDPKPFLEECVYDMCVTGGERLTLCRGLNAYAQACVDLGISVREWRSRTNCREFKTG